MKPDKAGPPATPRTPKHPEPLGTQQGVADKAANAAANVKARVESKNMPDKPPLQRQHSPNSSGRK